MVDKNYKELSKVIDCLNEVDEDRICNLVYFALEDEKINVYESNLDGDRCLSFDLNESELKKKGAINYMYSIIDKIMDKEKAISYDYLFLQDRLLDLKNKEKAKKKSIFDKYQ